MGKVTVHCSGNLKKLIIFPGWVRLTESKYVRFDHIDPGTKISFGWEIQWGNMQN